VLALLVVWGRAWVREFPRDPEPLGQLSPLARARAQAGLLVRAGRVALLADSLRAGTLRRIGARVHGSRPPEGEELSSVVRRVAAEHGHPERAENWTAVFADRTVLDLAGVLSPSRLESAVDAGLRQKLVTLDSVALGGARVKNVPATVSPSMRYGLLGLSYFNHFQYSIDPVKGLVRLQHNDLEESGVLKGGRSRAQWKQQFAAAHARIRAMEQLRDEVPFSKTRTREARAEEIERLHRELKKLENEADDARVPFSWRE